MNQTEKQFPIYGVLYVPKKIPMLDIPLKVTDEVNFVEELHDFINNEHSGEPSYHKSNIKILNRLRQDILGAGKDMIGKNILYKYMKELEGLKESVHLEDVFRNVKFKWYIL